MRRDKWQRPALRMLCCAAFVGLICAYAGAQEAESPPDEAKQLEERLADAMGHRDAAALDRLLAPDFVLRSAPDVDRATWLRNAQRFCWGDRFDIDDFGARPEDGVLVTAFVLTFYKHPETCQPAVLRSLMTDVWRLGPDGWQLTVRHSAPVPQPGAGVAAQYGVVAEAPPVWAVDGQLSLVATAGTSSTRTLGLGTDTQHRSDRSTTRVTFNFITTEAEEVTQAEALTSQARHGITIGPHAQVFGRATYARDRFAGIDNRLTIDAGTSYTATLSSRQTLTVEAGVGSVNEQRRDGTTLHFASANGTGTYIWKVNGTSEVHEDATLTADLQQGRNWRATSATSFLIALNRMLSLKVSHALEYRHAPVAGFGRTDMRTAAALVVTLRQHRPIP